MSPNHLDGKTATTNCSGDSEDDNGNATIFVGTPKISTNIDTTQYSGHYYSINNSICITNKYDKL